MKKPLIRIYRITRPRFLGIADAARALGVSKQAVSNFVTGRCVTCISRDKAALIQIVDKK